MEFPNFTMAYMHRCRMLYTKMIARVVEPYALNHTEASVLVFLYNNPAFNTAKDISVNRMIAKSNVSTAIDVLKSRGYLTTVQDAQNRRVVRIFLTEEANEVARILCKAQVEYQAIMEQGFTKEELAFMEQLFQRSNENVQAALSEMEQEE